MKDSVSQKPPIVQSTSLHGWQYIYRSRSHWRVFWDVATTARQSCPNYLLFPLSKIKSQTNLNQCLTTLVKNEYVVRLLMVMTSVVVAVFVVFMQVSF